MKSNQIEELIHSGISKIQISTGPWAEELYEKIYRNKSYKKAIRNVRLLLEKNLEAGCPVEIKIAFRSNLTIKETLSLPDYKEIEHLPHTTEFNTDFDTWTGEIKQQDYCPACICGRSADWRTNPAIGSTMALSCLPTVP